MTVLDADAIDNIAAVLSQPVSETERKLCSVRLKEIATRVRGKELTLASIYADTAEDELHQLEQQLATGRRH